MGWSDTYAFSGKTHHPEDFDETNIISLADWGGGVPASYTKKLMLEQMKLTKIDVILHGGDFAYDLDDLEGMVGDAWFNMIQPVAANIPYMGIPGNHELAKNGTQFKNRFKLPVNEANQGTGYFFSIKLGRAHYVLIDTEHYLDKDFADMATTQFNWLKNDLKEANENRSLRPWIIVITHRNLYCSVD